MFYSTEVPEKPVGPIDISNLKSDSVTLTWRPPSNDGGSPVTGYNVEYRDVRTPTWLKAGSVDAETTIWTQNKLLDDTEYMFKVTAFNKMGESTALETDTLVKPQKPLGEVVLA